jgi:hypothetical protein
MAPGGGIDLDGHAGKQTVFQNDQAGTEGPTLGSFRAAAVEPTAQACRKSQGKRKMRSEKHNRCSPVQTLDRAQRTLKGRS